LPSGASVYQIVIVQTLPPYAVPAVEFRFRGLTSLAGRLPLGGERELMLALLMSARLSASCVGAHPIAVPLRVARSGGAKNWLAALALQPSPRGIVTRLVEATATDNRRALTAALDAVMQLAAPLLDPPATAELRALARSIAAAD